MAQETGLKCALCGTKETERPLLETRFEGEKAWFCPGCMPALIHGMAPEEVAARVRAARASL